jgi:hypothetical protein
MSHRILTDDRLTADFAERQHTLSDRCYWECASVIWGLLKGCPITPRWQQFLTSPRAEREYFCADAGQRGYWKRLPDSVTLFRGCSADPCFDGTPLSRRDGYFWTLSPHTAREKAAQGDKSLKGLTFTMQNVKKSDCLFYGNGADWEVQYLPNLTAHLEKYAETEKIIRFISREKQANNAN